MEHSNSTDFPRTEVQSNSVDATTAAHSTRPDDVLVQTHDYPTVYERMTPSEGLHVINATSADDLEEDREEPGEDEANTETAQDDRAQQQQQHRCNLHLSHELLAIGTWDDVQWPPAGNMQELNEWLDEIEHNVDEDAVRLDIEEATREIRVLIAAIDTQIEAMRSDPDITSLISESDVEDESRVIAAIRGRWPLHCPVTEPIERMEPEGFLDDDDDPPRPHHLDALEDPT